MARSIVKPRRQGGGARRVGEGKLAGVVGHGLDPPVIRGIGRTVRRGGCDRSAIQKPQYRLDWVLVAFRSQPEAGVLPIAPVEAALDRAEQDVGGLDESETGENLAGIRRIDRDRRFGH